MNNFLTQEAICIQKDPVATLWQLSKDLVCQGDPFGQAQLMYQVGKENHTFIYSHIHRYGL